MIYLNKYKLKELEEGGEEVEEEEEEIISDRSITKWFKNYMQIYIELK